MANILVIDDDPAVVESLEIMLDGLGHSVKTASNGVECLRAFADLDIDLIITDIIMPEKDGFEVLMDVRRSQKPPKVIVMSGGGRVNAREYLSMAEALGAAAILAKPFSMSELALHVNRILT